VAPQEMQIFLRLLILGASNHTDMDKLKLYLDKMKEVVGSVWPEKPTEYSVTKYGRLDSHTETFGIAAGCNTRTYGR